MNHDLPIIFISLILSAFFSGMEIAFVSSNKVRLELDLKQNNITGYILRTFYHNKENFISTLLVGNNIALVIYGIAMARLLEPAIAMIWNNDGFVLLSQTILSTLLVLFTGEFIPKMLFKMNSNMWLRIFALPLFIIYIALYPIAILATWVSRSLLHLVGIKIAHNKENLLMSKVDLDFFVQQSIDEAPKKDELETEVKLFQNALDFSKVRLRDCMIPRKEIIAVELSHTNVEELIERFTKTGLSKIMLYNESIDNIVGYIHSSELFVNAENWRDNIKPIQNVPETMSAPKLMKSLMRNKMSVAVVIDEFGGTGGIVTMEDLVEEIFGDIEDEHDLSNRTAELIAENEYKLSGRVEIEQLNNLFEIDFPESDDYMTIAGYILYHYQKVPKNEETIELGNYTFKIEQINGSKIELVRMKINK